MNTFITIGTNHGGVCFTAAYLAAFITAAGIMAYSGIRKGYPKSAWLLILLTGVVTFIIGDKISTYTPDEWSQVFTRFTFPATGRKNALGGIIGLFAGIFLAKAILRFNRPVSDCLAVALPVAMGISKIGCLLAGCCFGSHTDWPVGITYGPASMAYNSQLAQGLIDCHHTESLPVHPVQLYQVIGCLLIAGIVWLCGNRWRKSGSLFLFSVILYGVLRIITEFATDPGYGSVAARSFCGLNGIQWVISGVILPMILIVRIRESSVEGSSSSLQPLRITEFRMILLSLILSSIVVFGRGWFEPLERMTLFIFLAPVIAVLTVKIYKSHTLAGFRWIAPSILACSIGFMAQKPEPSATASDNVSFLETGFAGLIGKYAETLQRVTVTPSCGGNHYDYHTIARQSVPFYQAGLDITYNHWKGTYNKLSVGGRIFTGFETPENTSYTNGSCLTLAISPFFEYNWRWFGFQSGFSLGEMKVPFGQPKSRIVDGEIISVGHSTPVFVPALSARIGPYDLIYVEGGFPGLYPFMSPFPTFRAGIGSGLGKTNGTRLSLGYCGNGFYSQFSLPIRNKWVINASYADNFLSKDHADRVFTFGLHYKLLKKKSVTQ